MNENKTAEKVTDQISFLTNSFTFAGVLAELDPINTKVNGDKTTIYFEGVVQCGPDPVYCRRFKVLRSDKTKDGKDDDVFKKIVAWHKKAVPQTKNRENATMVSVTGDVLARDYFGVDEKLHENLEFRAKFFNEFKEYKSDITTEGSIVSLSDEERGRDDDRYVTGRKVMEMITMDFYHTVMKYKKVIIPKDIADMLDEGNWEKGSTVRAYFKYIPSTPVAATRRGFGEQRTTEGNTYLELQLTGGDVAFSEEHKKYLAPKIVKLMGTQRENALADMVAKGYQGKKTESPTATSTAKFGAVEDDDLPF